MATSSDIRHLAKVAKGPVTVYHVSPDADINRLVGYHSPHRKSKGIFVSPSKKAILDSWAGYVAGKKYRGDPHKSVRGPGTYDNLTLYMIEMPYQIYEEAARLQQEATGFSVNISADGWDEEVWIPDSLLKHLRIVGRKTVPSQELWKRHKQRGDKRPAVDEVKGTNAAARLYSGYLKTIQDWVLQGKIDKELARLLHQEATALLKYIYRRVDRGEPLPKYEPKTGLTSVEKSEVASLSRQIEKMLHKVNGLDAEGLSKLKSQLDMDRYLRSRPKKWGPEHRDYYDFEKERLLKQWGVA